MRNFSAIVGVTLRFVRDFAQDRSNLRRIAPQLVCDDSKWLPSLAPQKPSEESFRGPLIGPRLNQDVMTRHWQARVRRRQLEAFIDALARDFSWARCRILASA